MSGVRNFTFENLSFENWGDGGGGIDIVGGYDGIIRNQLFQERLQPEQHRHPGQGGCPRHHHARQPLRQRRRPRPKPRRLYRSSVLRARHQLRGPGTHRRGQRHRQWLHTRGLHQHGRRGIPLQPLLLLRPLARPNPARADGHRIPQCAERQVPPQPLDLGKWRPLQRDDQLQRHADYASFTFSDNQWYNRTNPANSVPNLPPGVTQFGNTYGVNPNVDSRSHRALDVRMGRVAGERLAGHRPPSASPHSPSRSWWPSPAPAQRWTWQPPIP